MQPIKQLLSIGSVVLLKDADKSLMICGVRQSEQGKEYDYIGVGYPEGYLGGQNGQYLFNHIDIQETLFSGYDTDERKAFLTKLYDFYSDVN